MLAHQHDARHLVGKAERISAGVAKAAGAVASALQKSRLCNMSSSH